MNESNHCLLILFCEKNVGLLPILEFQSKKEDFCFAVT